LWSVSYPRWFQSFWLTNDLTYCLVVAYGALVLVVASYKSRDVDLSFQTEDIQRVYTYLTLIYKSITVHTIQCTIETYNTQRVTVLMMSSLDYSSWLMMI